MELTEKFERGMEEIVDGKVKSEAVIADARKALEAILQDFKGKEKKIGQELMGGVRKMVKQQSTIGKCACGGTLEVKYSRGGKRFVGCSGYPKCTETFSLPHTGNITMLKKACEKCGLNIVSVKRPGRRPWQLCVRCGYVSKAKKGAEYPPSKVPGAAPGTDA